MRISARICHIEMASNVSLDADFRQPMRVSRCKYIDSTRVLVYDLLVFATRIIHF